MTAFTRRRAAAEHRRAPFRHAAGHPAAGHAAAPVSTAGLHTGSPATPAALIVTADPDRASRLARVAAAVGASAMRIDLTGPAAVPVRVALVLVDAEQVVALAERPVAAPVIVVAAGEMTAAQWQASLGLAARQVHRLDESDEDLVRRAAEILAEAVPHGRVRTSGRVLAYIGGRGGAGASSMAAATASMAQRRGDDVVLCDMDRFGAGLDLMVGVEKSAGMRWADIDGIAAGGFVGQGGAPRHVDTHGGRWAGGALAEALPAVPGGPGRWSVLGFGSGSRLPIGPAAATTIVTAIRTSGSLAVVDLPRTFDDTVLAAVGCADLTVIATTADVRGCYGAARAAEELGGLGSPLGLVVRGPAPTGIAATEIAKSIGLPLVTAMRPQPRLDRDLDCGRAPGSRSGPLARAAGQTLDYLQGRT